VRQLVATLILGACLAFPTQAAAEEVACCWWVTVKAEGKATVTWPGDAFAAEQEGEYNYQGSQTHEWNWTLVHIMDYHFRARGGDWIDERTERGVLKSDFHETHKDLCRWDRNFDLEGGPFGCWDRPCDIRWRTGGFVPDRTGPDLHGGFVNQRRRYLSASAPQHYTFPRREPEGSCTRTGYDSEHDLIPVNGPLHGPWDYVEIQRPTQAQLRGTKSFNIAPKRWTGSHGEQAHQDARGNYPDHSSEATTRIVFCFKHISSKKIKDAERYLTNLGDPQARDNTKKLPACEFPTT
jgi:hypothetical protein